MRIILRLVSCVIVAASTLYWSCTNEPAAENTDAVNALILSNDSIEATANGGEFSVAYTLAQGYTPQHITTFCDAAWIEKVVCDDSRITVYVEANKEPKSRTATIEFDYNGTLQDATLTIAQAASSPNDDIFGITIEEIKSTSCITTITPPHPDMLYVMDLMELSYFQENDIDTADKLIGNDKFYFDRGAIFDEISLRDYMTKYEATHMGELRTEWSNLCPGVSYILYVYGIEFNADGSDYDVITPISYQEMIPTPADIKEGIGFDINLEISGPDVHYTATPQAWDGFYVIDVYDSSNELYRSESDVVEDTYTATLATNWILSCQFYINNYAMSYEDIIDRYCNKGPYTGDIELLSDTKYMMAVYAVEMVDNVLQVVSSPTISHFSTERVIASELTLDIKIENLYSHICDISITPSNDNEPYLMLLTPTSLFEDGIDDNALIDLILSDYSHYTYKFRGSMHNHINTLNAATEYAVFAFGYHGGVVTTPLFKNIFTTEEAAPGTNAVIEVAYGGPYDPTELADYNPEKYGVYYNYAGLYLMWMETITERATDDRFHMFVDTETFYTYGEQIIFSDLVAFVCDPITITYGSYDTPYYVLGAAMDEIGNYSEMWQSESIVWSMEDKRPIEELIEKIEGSASTSHITPLRL